jgi:hypothetical protein
MTKEVPSEPVNGPINDRANDANRAKYLDSPYLSQTISVSQGQRRVTRPNFIRDP